MSANLRSIKRDVAKFDCLRHTIETAKPDVAVFVETWLTQTNDSSSYNIGGYTLFRADRAGKAGGGIAIYARTDLRPEATISPNATRVDGLEQLWVRVTVSPCKQLIVGSFYRPARASAKATVAYIAESAENCHLLGADFVLAGDLNIDLLGDSAAAVELKSTLSHYQLLQLVQTPTRVTETSATLLDVIITNVGASKVVRCENYIFGDVSDHDLVYCCLKRRVKLRTRVRQTVRSFERFAPDRFRTDLIYADKRTIYEAATTDAAAKGLQALIVDALDAQAPLTSVTRRRPTPVPWITAAIQQQMSVRDALRRTWRCSASPTDRARFDAARRDTRRSIAESKRKFFADRLESARSENDARRKWQLVRQVVPKAKVVAPAPMGVLDANALATYYARVARPLSAAVLAQLQKSEQQLLDERAYMRNVRRVGASFTPMPVDVIAVRSVVVRIPNHKTAGYDLVPPRIVKLAAEVIPEVLVRVYNRSMSEGVFPTVWKQGVVVPIPKTSGAKSAGDFRPITLLPMLGKVLEKLMAQQLYWYLEREHVLPPSQSGFRSGRSTQTLLVRVCDDILKSMDRCELSISVLLDLSKAFDCINHTILIEKLAAYGVTTPWFRSFLADRTFAVRCDGRISSVERSEIGVPQGSCLGPLLFLVYVADLGHLPTTARIDSYADDTQLSLSTSIGNLPDAVSKIDADLRLLGDWFQRNLLVVNASKSEYIVFGAERQLKDVERCAISLSIGGQPIPRARVVKNLGIMMDEKLSFDAHVRRVVQKSTGAIIAIRRTVASLPRALIAELVNSLVFSIIDYCLAIYGGCALGLIDRLQKVQNFGAKMVVGRRRRRDHVSDVYATFGWLRVAERVDYTTASLMHSLAHSGGPDNLNEYCALFKEHGRRGRVAAVPRFAKAAGSRSFLCRGVRLWNELDRDLRGNRKSDSFRTHLKRHLLAKDRL